MKIDDIPNGSLVYVDANIFIYHFGASDLHNPCTNLLNRIQRGSLQAISSTVTILEITHRLMILEAVEKYNLKPKLVLKKLKSKPALIKDMRKYSECIESIYQMRIDILPIYAGDILESAYIRKEFGLLTNDSIILASMKRYGVKLIATNDRDFERIHNIKVYKP